MFGKLKERLGLPAELVVAAPAAGKMIPLSEVKDPAFSEEILGMGAAVIPTEGKIFSPFDGTVDIMFRTGHAVSLRSRDGIEVLIHVGLDTVKLAGKYFTVHRRNGDTVKKGDLLIDFDLESIQAEGYDPVIPVVVCNTEAFSAVEAHTGTTVAALDVLLTLKK